MERRLKYAMVGGGKGSFIGPIHRMAIRMDDLADLVDGCYSHEDSWQDLLARVKGKVDFIAICTPNDSHYAIAKAALEADLDVMCEKPLSITLEEAAELEALAASRGRVLAIPFAYSGFPMVKLARDLVRKGELGKIDKIVLEYQQGSFRQPDRRNGWKMNPKIAGPSCVVADIGVHAFTLIEYVTGLEVKTILSDLTSFTSGGLDDDASILMRLSEGAKASLVTSKIATGEENGVRLRVYGNKASLYWDQEAPNYLHVKYPTKPEMIYKRKAPYVADISAAATRASRFPAGHHEGFVEALANVYDSFVAAVRSRKKGDFHDECAGIRSMRFVTACLKSAKAKSAWTRL